MGRRIFISDMHMGDKRSINPGNGFHPYCWFYNDQGTANGNRPDMLASFLEQYCFKSDIEEVVVLGDLFDQWVCPVGSDPTDPSGPEPPPNRQFMNIADADHNKKVTDLLRQLALKDKLKYLTGNHDMLADKKIMSAIFPKIEYIDAPGNHAVYKTDDGIWAEHGHWYGLFNAPLSLPRETW